MALYQDENGDWQDDGKAGAEMPIENRGGYQTGSDSNANNAWDAAEAQGAYGSSTPVGDGTYTDIDRSIELALSLVPKESSLNAESLGLTPSTARESSPPVPTPTDLAKPQPKEESLIDKVKKMFGDVNEFSKKEKDSPLLMMGLAGLASHFKDQNTQNLAAKQNMYAKDQLDHAAKIEADKRAAYNASILAMPKTKGIIAGRLKRKDGSNVFKPNGTIA